MSFLSVKGLVKKFGDFTAVQRMDLSVEKGEFLSLLGPSGCGKTTTLQMIAGLIAPTEGRVIIGGVDVTNLPSSKRQLGIVFQSYALFQHMTVAENVSFGLEMRKVEKAERHRRVQDALALVKLDTLAGKYPRELSGGQQQRVALARALVIQPEILLLDEPLSALDARIREEMQIELRSIQNSIGTTTILVTHDQTEAMALSDRIAVMNKGRLVQVDKPYQAYEYPGDNFVSGFLGKSNMFAGKIVSKEQGLTIVDILGHRFKAQAPGFEPGTKVSILIRPEKINISTRSNGLLGGIITAQIFLGGHWLLQVKTDVGTLTVTCRNVGSIQFKEGDSICLDWAPEELRVLPREKDNG